MEQSLIFTCGEHSGGELVIEYDSSNIEAHKVHNNLVLFDGASNPHWTNKFEGTRYAVILYSMGKSYEETPGLTRAFLSQLGYRLPPADFNEEVTPEFEELATKACSGQEVPDEPGRHVPPGAKRKAEARGSGGPSKRLAAAQRSESVEGSETHEAQLPMGPQAPPGPADGRLKKITDPWCSIADCAPRRSGEVINALQ
eukprot:Skav213542  [mRNA]  locus=scaffold4151:179460:180997:- [translate_table: standard]